MAHQSVCIKAIIPNNVSILHELFDTRFLVLNTVIRFIATVFILFDIHFFLFWIKTEWCWWLAAAWRRDSVDYGRGSVCLCYSSGAGGMCGG